jgi:hypothetical protein
MASSCGGHAVHLARLKHVLSIQSSREFFPLLGFCMARLVCNRLIDAGMQRACYASHRYALDARELQTINSEGSRKYRLLELEGRRDR